jgi:hypothetical protein
MQVDGTFSMSQNDRIVVVDQIKQLVNSDKLPQSITDIINPTVQNQKRASIFTSLYVLKRVFVSTILLGLFSLSFAKDTLFLRVEVDNLRNQQGVVQFTLYNKDGSIPDEHYVITPLTKYINL